MESSLGAILLHDETSYGPFGLSLAKMQDYYPNLSDEDLIDLAKDGFEWAADLAMDIFQKERQWLINYGYTGSTAWQYAYQRYNAGRKWRKVKRKGLLFNKRVIFLKDIYE